MLSLWSLMQNKLLLLMTAKVVLLCFKVVSEGFVQPFGITIQVYFLYHVNSSDWCKHSHCGQQMYENSQSRARIYLIATELPWSELTSIGYFTELTVSVGTMTLSAQPITLARDWSVLFQDCTGVFV